MYADVVYQYATRYFTIEADANSQLAKYRAAWEADPTNASKYNTYYSALVAALGEQRDQVSLNAI